MIVVTDGTPLMFRRAGIGRYTHELLQAFARSDPPTVQYVANLGFRLGRTRLPRPLTTDALDRFIQRRRYWGVAFHVLMWRFRARIVAAQTAAVGANIYFAPNYLGVYGKSFRTVITVHDLGYHLYPEYTQPDMLRALRADLPRHLDRADGIVTDAESTKRDLVSVLGVPVGKVAVVPLGTSAAFHPVIDPTVLRTVRTRYGLPDRFVLFVGTVEPRKNLLRLFTAIERLATDPELRRPLVVVGARGWKSEATMARLAELTGRGLAVHLGYVPDADLAAIYSLADLFVFPSVYEGFGIPPLEAMACGVPVVSSSSSSLPEVCGTAAVYVDPGSEDEMVAAMRRVLTDTRLADALRQEGFRQAARFSWRNTAEALLRYFEVVRSR